MNAETESLLEKALKHVMEESAKLLQRDDLIDLRPVAVALNKLASETHQVRVDGVHRLKSVPSLIILAKSAEHLCDDISEKNWKYIPMSVSAIYENIEASLRPAKGEKGAAAELRSHYDKIRIRLLQQALGAKMLDSISDRGAEIERVWQQFLQNALGDTVRVLQGGVICDYQGNASKHQIDLIVVPTEALVTFPSGAEDGKVHVPIDQVISAIMVTSNLTAAKLRTDWEKLIAIPEYTEKTDANDHPQLKDHPWPLRYIVGAQSDPIETLGEAWVKAAESFKGPAPEFVVTLDSGFLYSGATKWPRPQFPRKEVTDVRAEEGVYRGLGLAWLLLQHQGRLAVLHRRALGPINRQAKALNYASLKNATPPTWSPRFYTGFQPHEVAGIFEWAWREKHVHNRLLLTALNRKGEHPLFKEGFSQSLTSPFNFTGQRWFRYGAKHTSGDLVALEEWFDIESPDKHSTRIAVFNAVSGEELTGPEIDALKQVSEVERLVPPTAGAAIT